MTALDPWATGLPPEPRTLTRDDRTELAARALMGYAPDRPWSEDDLAPISTMGDDTSIREVFIDLAVEALDAAYPQVTTADELDALPVRTLIVSDTGTVMFRALAGGLNRANGMDVGTLQVWEQPGERESGRKPRRLTSEQVAAQGTWTVVWMVAS